MTLSSHLTHIGQRPDHNINLIDAALGLAQYSNNLLDVRPHQRHVDRLILDAKFYIGSDTETLSIVLESVREIIAKRYGFVSEMKSDALSDATLISTVIETRRGSALTLCLLYAHVLENLDQNVEIID
ncbi:MAG: hypothetical protein JKY92_07715, partial [Magnetovibrio sp.]|nr:hypothetical protein [Magnetovibrio sp.]